MVYFDVTVVTGRLSSCRYELTCQVEGPTCTHCGLNFSDDDDGDSDDDIDEGEDIDDSEEDEEDDYMMYDDFDEDYDGSMHYHHRDNSGIRTNIVEEGFDYFWDDDWIVSEGEGDVSYQGSWNGFDEDADADADDDGDEGDGDGDDDDNNLSSYEPSHAEPHRNAQEYSPYHPRSNNYYNGTDSSLETSTEVNTNQMEEEESEIGLRPSIRLRRRRHVFSLSSDEDEQSGSPKRPSRS
jgi:hypothetical protein